MSVRQQLNVLEFYDLIQIAQVEPEIEYLFRHALVQDAAYESLLRSDRKALHLLVGEALESLYPERCEELAAVLGDHFYRAGDPRAFGYFVKAGDLAFRQNANAEAVTHYSRAWEVARWDGVDASAEQLAHLCARLGRALLLTDRYPDSAAFFEHVVEVAQERSDRGLELAARIEYATILSPGAGGTSLTDWERGKAMSQQNLALASELGDRKGQAKSLWNLMLTERYFGNPQKAIEMGEQALGIARELDQPDLLAFILNDLFLPYTFIGDSTKAFNAALEARSLFRELGNLPMLGDNLSVSAMTLYFAGEFNKAIAQCEEAYEINVAIDNSWGQAISNLIHDLAYLQVGRFDKVFAINERAQNAMTRAGLPMTIPFKEINRGYAFGCLGAVKEGLNIASTRFNKLHKDGIDARYDGLPDLVRLHVLNSNLGEARALIEEGRRKLEAGITIPTLLMAVDLPTAEAYLALGEHEYGRAFASLQEAEIIHRRMGLNSVPPEIYYLKGKTLLAMKDAEAAHTALQLGREQAEAGGDRFTLWRILALLGQIAGESGHATEADDYNRQARAILMTIVDHIDKPDLRQSFVSLPDVQAVLATRT